MTEQTQVTASHARQSAAAIERSMRFPHWRPTSILWFLAALILALTFFFPVFFMVTSSFKGENEIFAAPIHWLPQDFQGLGQYIKGFSQVPLSRFFFNSALMASIDVVVTVIFSAMAGYG